MPDYQSLYRKYRSQTFADLVGQDAASRALQGAIISGRVAHAYLFSGSRGTGKTSAARLLAKAVNCTGRARDSAEPCNRCQSCLEMTSGSALDLIEIDAASNRGIDEIRDLREKVNLAPALGPYKIYIIDEAHMLTEPAFNALLKTLEEPPAHVVFVLCTTDAQKIPLTVIGRCQQFVFRRHSEDKIISRQIGRRWRSRPPTSFSCSVPPTPKRFRSRSSGAASSLSSGGTPRTRSSLGRSEDAGGAARPRRFRALYHRRPKDSAHGHRALPAVCLPAALRGQDHLSADRKTLEEPPAHVVFVLCTTDAQKIPLTVIGRCQQFVFRRHSEDKIISRQIGRRWRSRPPTSFSCSVPPTPKRFRSRSSGAASSLSSGGTPRTRSSLGRSEDAGGAARPRRFRALYHRRPKDSAHGHRALPAVCLPAALRGQDHLSADRKTLEEPPAHVVFVLCTTDAQKIPLTVIGRCQQFVFRRHSEDKIISRLSHIAGAEKVKVDADPMQLIARTAQGLMRDAVGLLDQLVPLASGPISLESARSLLGIADPRLLDSLLDHVLAGQAAEALDELNRVYAAGAELRQVVRGLMEGCRDRLVVALGKRDQATARRLTDELDALLYLGGEVRRHAEPRFLVEATLARLAVQGEPA